MRTTRTALLMILIPHMLLVLAACARSVGGSVSASADAATYRQAPPNSITQVRDDGQTRMTSTSAQTVPTRWVTVGELNSLGAAAGITAALNFGGGRQGVVDSGGAASFTAAEVVYDESTGVLRLSDVRASMSAAESTRAQVEALDRLAPLWQSLGEDQREAIREAWKGLSAVSADFAAAAWRAMGVR